ncbi:MAG: phosphohydrolase [SAR86 cluster bacterium]|uniref:Phosphohydrolase n=1 Tax=SAR86 cluster bacterium TaxID=2030880 RepID=A0A2A5C9V2_9GAMM|nr:MAG: phosphohydrolase [SAR86 cluster bacterium]
MTINTKQNPQKDVTQHLDIGLAPIDPTLVSLQKDEWQYSKKRSLDDFKAKDWALWSEQRTQYFEGQRVKHILRMLECQKDDKAYLYTVNNYYHCMQTATRMLRAGLSEEDVVVGLLHDVGFVTCNETHGEFSAALMRPFISERNHWMLLHHAAFQQYHCYNLPGCDRHARDQWQDHPYFAWTAEFVEKFDQTTINYDEEILPLEAFEPMVQRMFSRPFNSPEKK